MRTKRFPGVEILRAGTWTGVEGGEQTYTEADLDEFAAAYQAMSSEWQFDPALIPGHDLGLGVPRIGNVRNIRREGAVLLADFEDVPEETADALPVMYPNRSFEGWRIKARKGVEIGGRMFRQAITHVGLLGAAVPAVKGLKPLPAAVANAVAAAALEGAEEMEIDVPLANADAPLDPKQDFEEIQALHQALGSRMSAHVTGRPGAPLVSARLRGLWEEFVRIFNQRNKGGQPVANADPPPMAADAAMPAEGGGGGLSFDSADAFVAWLAGALGLSPSDYAGLARAVMDAKASSTAADQGGEPVANADGAEGATAPAGVPAQLAEIIAGLTNRVAAAEAKLLTDRVKADMHGDGKNVVPPALEAELVKLAAADDALYQSILAKLPRMALGERGAIGSEEALALAEPTAAQIAVAKARGTWDEARREELRRRNAARLGVALPEPKEVTA